MKGSSLSLSLPFPAIPMYLRRRIAPVEAPERSRHHHGHKQCAQSCNEDLNWIAQIKITDLAYKQVAGCDIECSPKHVHG
jgi:hypothetical protein